MGRAIKQDNRLGEHDNILERHDHRIKLLEDAFEELLYTNKLSNKKQKKSAKNNAEA
jgi:hypothetical protein